MCCKFHLVPHITYLVMLLLASKTITPDDWINCGRVVCETRGDYPGEVGRKQLFIHDLAVATDRYRPTDDERKMLPNMELRV